jgi:DNA-binding response OmpR family regulator
MGTRGTDKTDIMKKLLLAEDDPLTHLRVEAALAGAGYVIEWHADGQQAWDQLQRSDAPRLALLDWSMPGLDGPEIVRRARAKPDLCSSYLILLTARDTQQDIVAGLAAGADDYVRKPFDNDELRHRVRAGERILDLQASLADRVRDLERTLARVTELEKFLTICSYCKKIRAADTSWEGVEGYLAKYIDVRFSHGYCPQCYDTRVRPELEKLNRKLPPYPTK